MSHTCKALVIHCLGFRFATAIRDFLLSLDLEDRYDLVCLAGATKGLVEKDPVISETILRQISTSKRLHDIREVLIIHHQDCGAYGEFDSLQSEKVQHYAHLKKAAKIISDNFPELKTKLYFATLKEKGNKREIGFEEVK